VVPLPRYVAPRLRCHTIVTFIGGAHQRRLPYDSSRLGLAPPVRAALPARSFRIRPNRLSRPPSWAEPACLLGDLVLDPRWHFREYGPRNQAIRLEFAQLGRQHVLGDAGIAFRSSPKRWTLWLSSHMISSFHFPESRAMPSFMFVLAEHTAGARTALPDCRK
jgi:hypothetical protein